MLVRALVPVVLVPVVLVALATAACGSSTTEPDVEFEVIEEVQFAPSLGINLSRMTRTNLGIYYEDLVVGEGDDVRTGDWAFLDHRVWLRTGVEIQSGPTNFVVGSGAVVSGFDFGVRGMRVGGTRTVLVPPGLAYGAQGSANGLIPPGAILVYRLAIDSIR